MALIKRREKAKKIAHILAAVIMLIHGYEKWEKGESSYRFFFFFGILFLILVFFHKSLTQKIKWGDGIFHGIEAIILFIIAYDYFHHGKMALPLTYTVAGIGYVIAAIVISRKGMKERHPH